MTLRSFDPRRTGDTPGEVMGPVLGDLATCLGQSSPSEGRVNIVVSSRTFST